MREAVQSILRLKEIFDYNAHHTRNINEKNIVRGEEFIYMILPFSVVDYKNELQNRTLLYVPSKNVLAGCYKRIINNKSKKDTVKELDDATMDNKYNVALYSQIGPFPLFTAYDGKNRVSLYRELNRHILARVLVCPYPEAKDLELVKLSFSKYVGLKYIGNNPIHIVRHWQLVTKNIAILPFNESVDLLSWYGVKWGKPVCVCTKDISKIAEKAKNYVLQNVYIP